MAIDPAILRVEAMLGLVFGDRESLDQDDEHAMASPPVGGTKVTPGACGGDGPTGDGPRRRSMMDP